MSFTEDELQSFNAILDQRLAAHRQEMEELIDERVNAYRRDTEQRILTIQQDTIRKLAQRVSEYQNVVDAVLNEKFRTQQKSITEIVSQDAEQRQQQFEGTVDLMDVIGKALDDRLAILNDSMQRTVKNLEQYLSVRLHSLRDEFFRSQAHPQSYNGSTTNIQEVLHGIEHLERIIESMQVAMTANNALLSNRLYHHQQLPLERAHPSNQASIPTNKGMQTPLSIAPERTAKGQVPEMVNRKAEVEEMKGE